jgi:SAM-dependent methyltransferase
MRRWFQGAGAAIRCGPDRALHGFSAPQRNKPKRGARLERFLRPIVPLSQIERAPPMDFASHFDAAALAAVESPAPLQFSRETFETSKIQAAIEALPNAAYVNALEIGCGSGALTRKLALRCGALLAADSSAAAVADARARTADLKQVRVRQLTVPAELPEGRFDLIVISGLLTRFDAATLQRVAGFVLESLAPEGHCLLVNWLAPGARSEIAADQFISRTSAALQPIMRRRPPHFRIDVLERA